MTRGQAGFTLIEMLVAFALFALLSVSLFSSLRLGARVWDARDMRAATSARVEVVHDAVRRTLSRVAPATLPGEDERPIFSGRGDGVVLASPGPVQASFGGLQLLELALQADRLVLRRQPLSDSEDGPRGLGEPETVVLLEGVAELRLRYLAPLGWRDEWQGEGLPALIGVRVGFPPDDRRSWPELLVRPMIDTPP